MAAPYPPTDGVILTMAWQCNQDRYLCKIPYVCINTLNPTIVRNDFFTWAQGTLRGIWQAALATDVWCRGFSLEGMFKGNVLPMRQVYAPLAFKGAIAGGSDPQNTSMYGVYYSNTQAQLAGRTDVGKSFVGPCPEAKYANGAIDPAFQVGALFTLIDTIGQGFTSGSGKNYHRAVAARHTLVEVVYDAEIWFARGDVAAQRRRKSPLL